MSETFDGGKPVLKDDKYSPPVGPREMRNQRPGVGHIEPRYGMAGETLSEMPGEEFTGRPGLSGGTNHGNKGSQGEH